MNTESIMALCLEDIVDEANQSKFLSSVVLSWICGRLSATRIALCASYEIPLRMVSRIGLADPLNASENECAIASDPYDVTSMVNSFESAYDHDLFFLWHHDTFQELVSFHASFLPSAL